MENGDEITHCRTNNPTSIMAMVLRTLRELIPINQRKPFRMKATIKRTN
jgi:hypothetical protein